MESDNSEFSIILRNLTRKFETFTAVDHISFHVRKGEIFGLLGPNGAGKTTTIKMLTTLLEPTTGQAQVAGSDIAKDPTSVRQNIAYVPQMLSADGGLTGLENLELSAKLYRIPRAERKQVISDALKFMALENAANKVVRTYSGGMIRRLELAQSLLHKPKILFLDEPTIGLDPVAKRLVWEKLLEARSMNGMTILITTHDMEEADHLCDRIAIMHKSKIAAIGGTEELKEQAGVKNLEEVFAHFAGGSISEGGSYHDVKQTRRTAHRLG